MEVSGQLHAPVALLAEEEPPYPIGKTLGGPQRRYGSQSGEEKNSQHLPGIEVPSSSPKFRHYTDWATAAPLFLRLSQKNEEYTVQKDVQIFWSEINIVTV
jgi:hypothetical protein